MLEQVAQWVWGGLIPGVFQGQVGWGPGKSELVLDLVSSNPACGKGVGIDYPWGYLQLKTFNDCFTKNHRIRWKKTQTNLILILMNCKKFTFAVILEAVFCMKGYQFMTSSKLMYFK